LLWQSLANSFDFKNGSQVYDFLMSKYRSAINSFKDKYKPNKSGGSHRKKSRSRSKSKRTKSKSKSKRTKSKSKK
jgi:hypothetical protein